MPSNLVTSVHVLVAGGLANLVLSFALGFVLSARRMREPIGPHRWLLVAHTVALQEGTMLLGLAFAMSFAQLPAAVATTAAWLLVLASLFQDLSGVVNWLRRTNDQFAERSAGWRLASINAVLNTAGLSIVVVGVARGLLA